jgi:hypothetical protein
MSTLTESRFLRDVAQHQMTIVHEAGELRHIRYARPGTSNMSFNLTTVPGYLMFTGDMGAWTFTRLYDMFEFFRTDRRGDDRLYINLGYWSEKLTACDCNGRFDGNGATEFDKDKFKAALWRRALGLARNAKDAGADRKDRAELLERLKDVRGAAEDGEALAMKAAYEFDHPLGDLAEFYEEPVTSYRRSFVWACYAIAWGIQQYDAATASQATTERAA